MTTTEETRQPTDSNDGAPADETFGWTQAEAEAEASGGPVQTAREIVSQIQSAVGSVADKAGPVARDIQTKATPVARELVERATPVAREVGARAAGLAAMAGDKAGPIAAKAAAMTADAGAKLAEKSREVASDLRGTNDAAAAAEEAEATDTPA